MTPFQEGYLPLVQKFGIEVWINDIYEVWVYRKKLADHLVHIDLYKGKCTYLTIKRRDKKPIHDWRHFQIIKNELVGKEIEGLEIYPCEDRLVDEANQYHIICLPKGTRLKFGFRERCVDYTPRQGGFGKAGQRGLEE